MMNIHVSKLTEYTTPRINPNVNNGLWMVTKRRSRLINWKCRSRLINFNKCPTLVRDTDCGGGIGAGVNGTLCNFPSILLYLKLL